MSRVLPILFNVDMVRAILDGRKTVTRRVIKLPHCGYFENEPPKVIEPYRKNDILYVRETWNINNLFSEDDEEFYVIYEYKADDFSQTVKISEELYERYGESMGYRPEWRPSIHMPKQAARIWLKVTDVRVERLQEATSPIKYPHGKDNTILREGFKRTYEFIDCWNSTIKKQDIERYGWDANPWVWVIEFERCEDPESEE